MKKLRAVLASVAVVPVLFSCLPVTSMTVANGIMMDPVGFNLAHTKN